MILVKALFFILLEERAETIVTELEKKLFAKSLLITQSRALTPIALTII
jgi:hypothetical protein